MATGYSEENLLEGVMIFFIVMGTLEDDDLYWWDHELNFGPVETEASRWVCTEKGLGYSHQFVSIDQSTGDWGLGVDEMA